MTSAVAAGWGSAGMEDREWVAAVSSVLRVEAEAWVTPWSPMYRCYYRPHQLRKGRMKDYGDPTAIDLLMYVGIDLPSRGTGFCPEDGP